MCGPEGKEASSDARKRFLATAGKRFEERLGEHEDLLNSEDTEEEEDRQIKGNRRTSCIYTSSLYYF